MICEICFLLEKWDKSAIPTVASYFKPKSNNLSEVLVRMAAKDGLSFLTIAKSEYIRSGLVASGFLNVPKSANAVKSKVASFSKELRTTETAEIEILKARGLKFSVTIDEWALRRRRR